MKGSPHVEDGRPTVVSVDISSQLMKRSVRVALSGASLVLVAACATTEPAPSGAVAPPALGHFDGQSVSFDYPGEWAAAQFDVVSSFSDSIVYLSTSALSDPCDRGPNSIACVREAASALGRNGLLLEWSSHGFPGWTFDPTKGRLVDVAGRRATVDESDPSDSCVTIGGERELVVTIDDPLAADNWTEVRACLRGPDLAGLRTQIDAMLHTVRWHG